MTRNEQPAELACERSERSGTISTNRIRRATGGLGGSPANSARARREWPQLSHDDDPTTIHVAIVVCDDQVAPHAGLSAVDHAMATGAPAPQTQGASHIRAWPGRVGSPRLTDATRTQPAASDEDEPTNVSHGAQSRVRALCEPAAAQQPMPRENPVRPVWDDDEVTHLAFGAFDGITAPDDGPATIPAARRQKVRPVVLVEGGPSARSRPQASARPARPRAAAPLPALSLMPTGPRFPPLHVLIHTKSPPTKEPAGSRQSARGISAFTGAVCMAGILSTILLTIASGVQVPPRSVSSPLVTAEPDTKAATVIIPWAVAQPEAARIVPFAVAPDYARPSGPAPSGGTSDPSLPPIPYR